MSLSIAAKLLFFIACLHSFALGDYDTKKKRLNVAVVTDTHIGENCHGDLSYDLCKPTRALMDAVSKINSLPIDAVFATGDLTGSALREEFAKTREILDGLEVPWWPLLGNHDSWPYTRHEDGTFDQTATPEGDVYFKEIFGDKLVDSSSPSGATTRGWTGSSVTNADFPEYTSIFHNFEVTFPRFSDRLRFVALDWVARGAALPEPGVGPEVELHDFEGGTFQWFDSYLNTTSSSLPDAKIFIMQHHPFHNRDALDPFGQNRLFNFTFDKQQDALVQELVTRYYPIEEVTSSFLGVHAGHMHRWFSGDAFTKFTATSPEWMGLPAFETPASKGWWVNEDFVSSFTTFSFEAGVEDGADAEITLSSVVGMWRVPKDGSEWQDGEWEIKPVLGKYPF